MIFSNRCFNRLCKDAFITGRGNLRRASSYGPSRRKRWRCRSCGKTFSERRRVAALFRLRKPHSARMARRLRQNGLSIRQIARVVGADKSSVSRWIHSQS